MTRNNAHSNERTVEALLAGLGMPRPVFTDDELLTGFRGVLARLEELDAMQESALRSHRGLS